MKYNDYELAYLAQEGNEEAINLLYQKYKPIIIKKSKDAIFQIPHHGIEINDIMQEGYIALDEAIKNFSQDNVASFYTFAILCIDRQISNYIKKNIGRRDRILNEAVTIDDTLEKIVGDDSNVEFHLIQEEQLKILAEKIEPLLTTFEKLVFNRMLNNDSFEEIANDLHKDVKSIYNTFQRIKFKIKKNIKFDN